MLVHRISTDNNSTEEYSLKNSNVKNIEDNSVLYPEVNSDSASDKSNGVRLSSLSREINSRILRTYNHTLEYNNSINEPHKHIKVSIIKINRTSNLKDNTEERTEPRIDH